MFCFAEDQVTVADSEDALQISVFELETITSKYALKCQQTNWKQRLLKEEIQWEVQLQYVNPFSMLFPQL